MPVTIRLSIRRVSDSVTFSCPEYRGCAMTRFTFGQVALFGFLGYVEVIIGIVAVAEVFRQLGQPPNRPTHAGWRDMMMTKEELRRTWKPASRRRTRGLLVLRPPCTPSTNRPAAVKPQDPLT